MQSVPLADGFRESDSGPVFQMNIPPQKTESQNEA